MNIRIYIYGQKDQTAAMRQMFAQAEGLSVVGETDLESAVLDEINRLNVDILLLYVDGTASVYRVAQQVYMLQPQCVNFALAPHEVQEQEFEKNLQSGIRYIYDDTLSEDQVISYIKNAYTIEINRRNALESKDTTKLPSKVLTFYSPKDGLGKSTFLLNLAVHIVRLKKKVAVLDFNLQFGDINVLTGIETRETVAELLQEQSNPTIDIVRQYITYHKSGISVLCAPRNVEYAEKIQSNQIEKIINSLRPYYDYILIDAATSFDEILYTCFEQSSEVYMPVRSEISVLKHAKKAISLMESLGQKDKLRLLLCDFQKGSRVEKKDIERVLGIPIWHTVAPDFKYAIESLNQGEPVAMAFPKSALSKSCAAAAKKIVHIETSATHQGKKVSKKWRKGK